MRSIYEVITYYVEGKADDYNPFYERNTFSIDESVALQFVDNLVLNENTYFKNSNDAINDAPAIMLMDTGPLDSMKHVNSFDTNAVYLEIRQASQELEYPIVDRMAFELHVDLLAWLVRDVIEIENGEYAGRKLIKISNEFDADRNVFVIYAKL